MPEYMKCEECHIDHAVPVGEFMWIGTPEKVHAQQRDAVASLAGHQKNTAFDAKYAVGSVGEDVIHILFGETPAIVEVKTRGASYANSPSVAVERACYSRASGNWQPSGIDVTEASLVSFVILESTGDTRCVLSVPVERLKVMCKDKPLIECNKGSANPTRCNIVRLHELLLGSS